MSTKIKWGIIGLGKIASKMASDLQLSKDSVLHAVASRDKDKAQNFGEKYKAPKCYASYEALAMDPDIDVVYIATPHSFHYAHTMLCLENNKSVLCEKPMGMNAAEVKRMVNKAASRNLFLMEGLWTRFIPATEKMLEVLHNKVIGDIISIRADFGFKAALDPKGRIYNKALGGGSLLDIGIYPIYLSLLTLGMPVDIQAMARMTPSGVDSFCAMLFNYKNDAKAILESTLEADTPIEAYLYGTDGMIKMHSRFHHTEKLSVYQNKELKAAYVLKYKGEGYIHEIEEVEQCLKHKQTESQKVSHALSINLAFLMDQVKDKIGLEYE